MGAQAGRRHRILRAQLLLPLREPGRCVCVMGFVSSVVAIGRPLRFLRGMAWLRG